ncbi:MAG: DUF4118 domain-containing protein [Sphingobium sp.]|nr:DUF4118 domain-containing protein [Sphingobium sp.]
MPTAYLRPPAGLPSSFQRWGAAYASLIIFLTSTAGAAIARHFDRPVSSALVYILGVTVIGALSGLRGGLIAAIAASLIYNFFLVDPILQFTANSADELVPFIAFNVSAVISGLLAGRLNDRARIAERAQARLNVLLTVSSRLQKVVLLPDLVTAMNSAAIRPWLGRLELYDERGRPLGMAPADAGWADLVDTHLDWLTFRSEPHKATLYRLEQSGGTMGLAIFGDPEDPSDSRLVDMDAIVALLAMTLERCLLLQQLSQTEAVRRSEELKTALLSSLSHDMRTPLSAISASASSLLSLADDLDPAVRVKLLQTIQDQAARLDRYTANLLDLGRLQGGIDVNQLVDVDVVDILGSVLRSVRTATDTHVFAKQFEASSALVRANAVMVEQIFRNIIDNAVRYSPEGSTIALRLGTSGSEVRVDIIDQGCGVPKDELSHLFDRFYRSSRTAQQEGQGLGLSIAKGFVELFGGSIAIDSPHAGGMGAHVLVRMPLSAALSGDVRG